LFASNVSFGLPDRHSVNSAFLALAMQAGVTTSITDPIQLGSSMRYLKYFRAMEKLRAEEAAVKA
jgi:cobalamin-dependent methionine synthase I